MVSLIDKDVEKIRAMLEEKGIERNTLLVFTSDNGAAQRWEGTINSSGKLRGIKRDMYEGGIRVPLILSWPGTIPAGRTDSTTVGYLADVLPTFADFAGQKTPKDIDGISLKDPFLGTPLPAEQNDRVLYWEFHEGSGKQAIRIGKWKAVRLNVHEKGFHDEIELYNLEKDPEETRDLAEQFPDIVNRMKELMRKNHRPSATFPFKFEDEYLY